MDKFLYIISVPFLVLLFLGFDDYNESAKAFFNYEYSGEVTSHYVDSYISSETEKFSNGVYSYLYFIQKDSSSRRAGILQIDTELPTSHSATYTLPDPRVDIFYMEKRSGAIEFISDTSSTVTGWVKVLYDNIGSELTKVKFTFYLKFQYNGKIVELNQGYIDSKNIDSAYIEDNSSGSDNYYAENNTTVTCIGSSPYEDDEDYEDDDTGCAGSPSDSGLEDDNSNSSCSSEPQDESDSGGCSSDTEDDSSTDSSCGGSADDDDSDYDSDGCSGDSVEASTTFTANRRAKNIKRFFNFMTPVFILSLFIFFIKRREKKVKS